MDIYPTHTCFDDALENLIFLMKRDGRDAVLRGELQIVHAIIAPEDEDIGHAWVENSTSIWFTGILKGERLMVEVDRDEYLQNVKWKLIRKYTLWDAYAEEKRTGHYGPWDPRIIALCADTVTSKGDYHDN